MADENNNIFNLGDSDEFQQMVGRNNEDINKAAKAKIIKVIGVGGGGCNAINHMYQQDIDGVTYVVANTDRQALINSPVPTRLLLGPTVTAGLGAGNKPEVARKAAEESAADIEALFDDETKMVFITAGMGGGTGTGAGPVVARIAREKGVLTVGIVTLPFGFEGQKKIEKAIAGADEMGKFVDALLVINNQRLADIYQDLDFDNGFAKADDTLTIAARSISELITAHGKVNLDFKDVETTLQNGGAAIISTGYGEGEHRVTKAIEDALNSPLLKNRDVEDSKHILIDISFDPTVEQNKFKMGETREIDEFMLRFAPELDVITGVHYDNSLGEKVKVTILASGFNVTLARDSKPKQQVQERPREIFDPQPVDQPSGDSTDKIASEYGDEFMARVKKSKERAKYFVFAPEEFDNEELLELFESVPTYNRTAATKNRFETVRRTLSEKSDENAPDEKKSLRQDANSADNGSAIVF